MGKIARFIAMALPVLLGLTAVVHAGGGGGDPCEHAIVVCKTNKKGDFVVTHFSHRRESSQALNVTIGDSCTEALDNIEFATSNPGLRIRSDWIVTGSLDRTIYTARGGQCRDLNR